jgi:hypothetical protein
MPLLPIDLQTMFNQMTQVGREQAMQRDVSTQYQLLQGTEMARRTQQSDTSVNQARQVGEGLEKVKEEEERRQERRRRGKGEPGEEAEEQQGHIEDPDLGHYVDLSG